MPKIFIYFCCVDWTLNPHSFEIKCVCIVSSVCVRVPSLNVSEWYDRYEYVLVRMSRK